MPKALLYQKSQGVAYYGKMSKAQLVQAVTDPVKAAELSKEVKNNLKAPESNEKSKLSGAFVTS